MGGRTFSVEPAKSGRSTCKGCKVKISKDELRIGVHTTDASDHIMTKWYHIQCFNEKIRKKPESPDDLEGINTLSSKNKNKVIKAVFPDLDESESESDDNDNSSNESEEEDSDIDNRSSKRSKRATRSSTKNKSKSKSKSKTKSKVKTKSKGKKRKLSSSEDEYSSSDDDEPPRKKQRLSKNNKKNKNKSKSKSKAKIKSKSKRKKGRNKDDSESSDEEESSSSSIDDNDLVVNKEKDEKDKMKNDLSGYRVDQLKAMLGHNSQKKSGNKGDLIDRIIDCKLYGCLPRCEECGTGLLQVQYQKRYNHKGQGKWKCPGYMDDEGIFIRCKFKTEDYVERPKWEDI